MKGNLHAFSKIWLDYLNQFLSSLNQILSARILCLKADCNAHPLPRAPLAR